MSLKIVHSTNQKINFFPNKQLLLVSHWYHEEFFVTLIHYIDIPKISNYPLFSTKNPVNS